MAPRLDVIIFGATGFTGKHCVFEAIKILAPFKWGIAGRSQQKLETVLREMGQKAGTDISDTPIIIADVFDPTSLVKMSAKCRVLVNCSGPYRHYGEPVVKACIATGTDHVDVTGEPQFMERMQLEYNKEAEENNAFVVSACGYDSIPAEMGLAFAEKHFKGTVHSSEIFIKSQNSGLGATINYGTWESAIHILANTSELVEIRKKLFNGPVFKRPSPKLDDKPLLHKSSVMRDQWCIPNHTIDQSVMDRTQRFFQLRDQKHPIQTKEYLVTGYLIPSMVLVFYGLFLFIFTRFKLGVKLLLDYPAFFSAGFISKSGPTEAKMAKTNARITFYSQGWAKGSELTGAPTHDIITQCSLRNLGYGATNVALLCSAVSLLTERDRIPGSGGVIPPGAAFRETTMIERLMENGVDFKVIREMQEIKK